MPVSTDKAREAEGASAASKSALPPSRASLDRSLRDILAEVLSLEADAVDEFDRDSGLFGELPELDSMAVAGLLTEIEDRLEIVIEDDDVDGEMLETYGGLLDFVEMKVLQD